MRGFATIVAETRPDGSSRCTTLRSTPPFALRETPDGLHLAASAAGPVGGDDHEVAVRVERGASLTVRTVAAQLVYPGPHGARSTAALDAAVGARAELRWLPSPTVLIDGADHWSTIAVTLAADASLTWADIVVLGRHGEPSGSLRQRLRVDRDGHRLLRTDVCLGARWPGAEGPAGTAGARVVGTALLVGAAARAAWPTVDGVRLAAHPLAEDAVLLTALGNTVEPVHAALTARLTANSVR